MNLSEGEVLAIRGEDDGHLVTLANQTLLVEGQVIRSPTNTISVLFRAFPDGLGTFQLHYQSKPVGTAPSPSKTSPTPKASLQVFLFKSRSLFAGFASCPGSKGSKEGPRCPTRHGPTFSGRNGAAPQLSLSQGMTSPSGLDKGYWLRPILGPLQPKERDFCLI